jgi:hypothetical protein
MKTAMQELIERLDKTESQLEKENNLVMSSALFAAKSMALEALEKEKEQICNAYTDGLEGPYLGAEEYHNRTYNQKGIDAGIFLADLLKKELEELGDEDLEPREEVQNLGVDPVLRLKEDYDPNTINFRWNDTEEVILKISKEGFYYRGELVEDIHNVYERFNEWLTKIE